MKKTAIILSYQRPIYLWAALDSLFRATKSDVDYILVDQGSTDPAVFSVIDGFVARGMLSKVIKNDHNDRHMLENLFREHFHEISEVFFFIESDVVIKELDICWTEAMLQFMMIDPKLAMLGSAIDTSDFVSMEKATDYLGREPNIEELNSIKWFSPERTMPHIGNEEIASPFNPPGRLLALRKSALINCPTMLDSHMHNFLRSEGWNTGITGAVRHRHLSVLNLFDYPRYDMRKRDEFMSRNNTMNGDIE